MQLNMIYNEDCLDTMKRIPDGSVDLMLTDMPYGTTQNKWDILPNITELWNEWERILKPTGVWIFSSVQPMASKIILSREALFKCEIIWDKIIPTGHLNAKIMPMRVHENILIFSRGNNTFNPQMNKREAKELRPNRTKNAVNNNVTYETKNYGAAKRGFNNENKYDEIYPKTIIGINNGNGWAKQNNIHPTQKPVDLMRYLILTYTNKGETVFDGYMGSGTTAIAAIQEGRNYIGSELNNEYYKAAKKRIAILKAQKTIF